MGNGSVVTWADFDKVSEVPGLMEYTQIVIYINSINHKNCNMLLFLPHYMYCTA